MKNKNYGFTLLEVILTIALIGIVTPVIYSLFFSGQNSFKLGTEEVYEQQDHRLLRNYLSKELRYASYLSKDKPNGDSDKVKYDKYYSLELEDKKIIKKEYEKPDDWSAKNSRTLSSFKWQEIDFSRSNDLLTIKYRDLEYIDQEQFTILLENDLFKIEKSKLTSSKPIYYAMFQDGIDTSDSQSDPDTIIKDYLKGKPYKKGDKVRYQGNIYECTGSNCNSNPNSNHWTKID